MKTLINPGYVDARKFGVGPDFAVYTGPMRPMKTDELPIEDRGKPIVDMTGSSTIEDVQGDNMRITALQDMTQVHPDLVLWLNHTYEVPDSSYGKLYSLPRMEIQQKLVDLRLSSIAFLSNPPASRTYHLIKDEGARFGCSVGCMVTEMSFSNPEDPYNSTIYIDHVQVLEWSIVGIPANQRCWVENAIKGLFARSLVEGNGDKAISLAPAYKGLFAKNFDEAVRNITSAGLRKQLEHTTARFTKPHQIYYDFTEGREGFALRDSQHKTTKALSRNDVASILEQGVILDDIGNEESDIALQPIENNVEKSAETILDSESGDSLVRQDLAETPVEEDEDVGIEKKAMPAAKDVEVKSDGTHEVCKGVHSHSHPAMGSQGDDENHDHSHSHDGDANHDHTHSDAKQDSEKQETPELTATIAIDEETPSAHEVISEIEKSLEQETAQITETPSPVEESTVSLPSTENADREEVPVTNKSIDVQRMALLETYKFFGEQINTLSAQLGLPLLEMTDKGIFALTTKEGREISAKNQQQLQMIHDCVKAMHPGVCEGIGTSMEDAENEARMQGEGQPMQQQYSAMLHSFETVSNSLDGMTKSLASLEKLDVKSIVNETVNDALIESKKSLDLLQREQRVIMENVKRLKEMPLGRPTGFVGRTVTPAEDIATYEELLIAGKALSELSESDLEVIERNGIKFKRWPAGYRAGQRAALTDFQKTYMNPFDYYPYETAIRDVLVPFLDETKR